MRPTIVVAGSLAQRPGYGGHAWVFLQYLLGFRRLGYDVLFIDRLEPGMCVDRAGRQVAVEASVNLRYLSEVMARFGLTDRWCLLHDGGRDALGLPREEVIERVGRSAFVLNVMGYLDDGEILAAAPLRVFLDIDPGFGQFWQELGFAQPFHGHERHVTVGGNIGKPTCGIPTCGIDWLTLKPPVELSEWPARAGGGTRFTSVASWRGPFGPIEYQGRTYGLRAHEFRRFIELPQLAPGQFEVALAIDPADEGDRTRLEAHGWVVADPHAAAKDALRYRDYVRGSSAELMIAKNLYVDTRSGWLSDRSACYLATGRPVLAQDTGIEDLLPCGEGIVLFTTPDEAVAGAEEIIGNYDRHSRAARAVAEEHFAASRVLPQLMTELQIR
jgi:hypothetical protein